MLIKATSIQVLTILEFYVLSPPPPGSLPLELILNYTQVYTHDPRQLTHTPRHTRCKTLAVTHSTRPSVTRLQTKLTRGVRKKYIHSQGKTHASQLVHTNTHVKPRENYADINVVIILTITNLFRSLTAVLSTAILAQG